MLHSDGYGMIRLNRLLESRYVRYFGVMTISRYYQLFAFFLSLFFHFYVEVSSPTQTMNFYYRFLLECETLKSCDLITSACQGLKKV